MMGAATNGQACRRGSGKLRAIVLGSALLLASAITLPPLTSPAVAQSVYTAVLVNDVPISNYDISARSALLRLQGASSSQAASRAEDELIDEALQRAEARRLGISVTQAELDQALQTIASRSGLSVSQLGQALGQRGVDLATLRDSIEAQILWDQVIRARFQATVRVDEQDVLAALDSRSSDEGGSELTTTEYTLREVVFIVPEGSGANTREQRRREATAFRSRFESCAAGISAARQLNGVVVQAESRRFSSDLSPELDEMLQETPVGRLTPPEDDTEGVVMFAVCNKRDVRSDAEARRDVESELRNEEGRLLSRGYLRDLRASATILRPNN
ncbi:peptidylprolyl isomerase [Ahrensia marina]|uniref:SurA N-terminal domain-containing protein n=1 Tax=Ahrensia marina TaxID=1514904 RepID=UPI0035CF3D2F